MDYDTEFLRAAAILVTIFVLAVIVTGFAANIRSSHTDGPLRQHLNAEAASNGY